MSTSASIVGTLPPRAPGDRADKVNTATLAQTAQRPVGQAVRTQSENPVNRLCGLRKLSRSRLRIQSNVTGKTLERPLRKLGEGVLYLLCAKT
ncbi:hypothetical protein E2C01_067967 [Portunus trituberculatus]|uniref:Uncharacterized protein n=1 Tax=Portunus trituberculatus TaxID=210409 RepID=A0A5B7HL87_PORTR|nr:hypothetical protein [Portunus trituberculatus]